MHQTFQKYMVIFLMLKLVNLGFVLHEEPKQSRMCWNIGKAVSNI